jgi:hypothetical protein
MFAGLVSISKGLSDHDWVAAVVLAGITVLGLMKFSEWWFTQFVGWTHRMRLLWRKFRADPDPNAVHS